MKASFEKKFKGFLPKRLKLDKNALAGIEIGNVLVAISTTGFMAVGILPMSLTTLIILAIILLILGIVGRYMDEVQDDKERLKIYEESLNSNFLERVDYENTTDINAGASSSNHLHTAVSEDKDCRDGEVGTGGVDGTGKEN